MDNFKNAVAAALSLYAETSGMTLAEVGKMFGLSGFPCGVLPCHV